MSRSPIFQDRFNALSCCILVPTFNNAATLPEVLQHLLLYTKNILVLNDGSTDATRNIMEALPDIKCLHFNKNRGKGSVLKEGFQIAADLGYRYAITIDSDGQHYADDLEIFLNELEAKLSKNNEVLLVGDRNMGRNGVPGKSSTGNTFSNFWFLVVTGSQLNDTQSGYRAYPLPLVNTLKLYTKKFEFEIEILVKAAWRKVEVINVPIKVLYAKHGRVSHFRPFWDIVRIVLLYMWFVLVSFFYIHPRNKYQDCKKKGIRRFWNEDILRSQDSPQKKAAAIALGVFVGISPFWGIHTFLVFILASFFRLNKLIAFLFSNISIPPLIPFIIYASYQAGSLLFGQGFNWRLEFQKIQSINDVTTGLWQYILGSLALAGFAAIVLWIVFYFLFSVLKQKQVVKP